MFAASHIPYNQVSAFTKIIQDYLQGSDKLNGFYSFPPSTDGIRKIIEAKRRQPLNREQLVRTLQDQYKTVTADQSVQRNIGLLSSENTFTVCTAHQPNLFTGPLYFIYKILHTIRLANFLLEKFPDYSFVPVYYMGSEDADFAELNHTYVDGRKIEWKKEQTGAVGRMVTDQTLISLIDELEGQLGQEAFGKEVIGMLRRSYSIGKNIQAATFELVNEIYGALGLVVLIPDHADFKKQMRKVFEDDLFSHMPSQIVRQTSARLEKHYDAQAYSRDINLFYLKDNIRERIEWKDDHFAVLNTNLVFSKNEMLKELETHPERFSPNVILRGIYQETILPNIVFIGGGGELAYWMQLKDLFEHYNVVYPVLVLRNSFLIVGKKWMEKITRSGLAVTDFFLNENDLMKSFIKQHSENTVSVNGNMEKLQAVFEQISAQATTIDPTLTKHVASIRTRSEKYLEELEKKMFRAEKRKFSDQQQQIKKIREALFPRNGLQERVENFSSFYAKWGRAFIDELYRHSLSIEQEFTILIEEPS